MILIVILKKMKIYLYKNKNMDNNIVNILFIGYMGVGKTSIIRRFVNN